MPVTQTIQSFVNTLEDITVEGVVRHYKQGPPQSLTDADLPAKFIHLPRSTESALVFGEHGGVQSLGAEIWIPVVATVQSLQGENFDLSVRLMDNLVTALRAMGLCGLRSKWRISVVLTVRAIAEIDYWTTICTVES